MSQINDILQSAYYEGPQGYDDVDLFVDKFYKNGKKTTLFFRNSNNNRILAEKDGKHFRNVDICQFCQKVLYFVYVRDHCHLTS